MKWRKKIVIAVGVVYLAFAVSRYSALTTYIPFSGKIFRVEPESISSVMLQNGNTGRTVYLKDAAQIDEYIRALNDIRYTYALPAIPIPKGGWSYRFVLHTGDTSADFECGEGWIKVRGFVYYVRSDAAIAPVMEGK